MGLQRSTVALLIDIIEKDKDVKGRIESAVSVFGRHSGTVRNLGMALGFGIMDLGAKGGRFVEGLAGGPAKPWNVPLDPNRPGTAGFELQCTAIVEAAVAAIEKKKNRVPGLKEVSLIARSEGFAHAGVLIRMVDRSGALEKRGYVIDWWATLDVKNPIVYREDDFDKDRGDRSVEFARFTGFE